MSDIAVSYIHHCGDDLSVANAARVSRNKRHNTFEENDGSLINFLARKGHHSPFKHQFITMHVRAPIFVARQLVKHEYMPWNEISGRYVTFNPDLYEPDQWRKQSPEIKQGSSEETINLGSISLDDTYGITLQDMVDVFQHNQLSLYDQLLEAGVCKEQARMVLPLNLMTEWYWSGVLFSWMKMINLRLHHTTQKETRQVAQQALDILMPLFPFSTEALLNV